ncbi:hypothetical protein ACFQ08_11950, partial [Streptosporangium algeriense]
MLRTIRMAWGTPGCVLLLGGNFVVALGTTAVLPYLAVYLSGEQRFSQVMIAIAISVRFWAQQSLMLPGGWCSDRLGPVRALRLGLAVRALAY